MTAPPPRVAAARERRRACVRAAARTAPRHGRRHVRRGGRRRPADRRRGASSRRRARATSRQGSTSGSTSVASYRTLVWTPGKKSQAHTSRARPPHSERHLLPWADRPGGRRAASERGRAVPVARRRRARGRVGGGAAGAPRGRAARGSRGHPPSARRDRRISRDRGHPPSARHEIEDSPASCRVAATPRAASRPPRRASSRLVSSRRPIMRMMMGRRCGRVPNAASTCAVASLSLVEHSRLASDWKSRRPSIVTASPSREAEFASCWMVR
jgi:hypothetical protein